MSWTQPDEEGASRRRWRLYLEAEARRCAECGTYEGVVHVTSYGCGDGPGVRPPSGTKYGWYCRAHATPQTQRVLSPHRGRHSFDGPDCQHWSQAVYWHVCPGSYWTRDGFV